MLSKFKNSNLSSYLIIFFSYGLALAISISIYRKLNYSLWLNVLLADIVGMLIIWVISTIFNNASIYDPYWSIQPLVIIPLLVVSFDQITLGSCLLIIIITYWALRLTGNWAYTFNNLDTQDWRYDLLKEKSGRFYFIVNLLGIQFMPTVIVYMCILPAIYYVYLGSSINVFTILGAIICILGTTIELISDIQMQKFRKENEDSGKLMKLGLWKHSRHPNYFGEITMWWGIYIYSVSVHPDLWPLFFGALLNTILFLFISIPLAEKRLSSYKRDFLEYQKNTNLLIPIKKKS